MLLQQPVLLWMHTLILQGVLLGESIASSLTELLPHIHQQRLDTWPEKYPWVDAGMKYFKYRLGQARRDVQHGLEVTKHFLANREHFKKKALEILQFKLDVLGLLPMLLCFNNAK